MPDADDQPLRGDPRDDAAAAPAMTRALGLFGRGRLATAVAAAAGARVAWQCGRGEEPGGPVEVAIDCSAGDAVERHLEWALAASTDLVIATTGWRMPDLAARVGDRIGVVVAPNGSLTVALMERLVRALGGFAAASRQSRSGGYLLDHHHAAKRDAPSGTALRLAAAWREAVAAAGGSAELGELSVASVRAGEAPGVHTVGLDAPGEQIEIVHRARSREPFAHGLLVAADWVAGRHGTFTMDQVAEAVLGPLFGRDQP